MHLRVESCGVLKAQAVTHTNTLYVVLLHTESTVLNQMVNLDEASLQTAGGSLDITTSLRIVLCLVFAICA